MNKCSFRLFELLRDQAGIAALEFGFVAPILIIAFLGCYELTDYIRATMRTDQVAQSVGELIAHQTSVNNNAGGAGSIADYCYASQSVIVPYQPAKLTVQVASYTLSGTTVSKNWGFTCPSNDTSSATSGFTPAAPPTGLLSASGDSVIIVTTAYTWSPPDGGLLLHSGITATETDYTRPRSNATITCTISSSSSSPC